MFRNVKCIVKHHLNQLHGMPFLFRRRQSCDCWRNSLDFIATEASLPSYEQL